MLLFPQLLPFIKPSPFCFTLFFVSRLLFSINHIMILLLTNKFDRLTLVELLKWPFELFSLKYLDLKETKVKCRGRNQYWVLIYSTGQLWWWNLKKKKNYILNIMSGQYFITSQQSVTLKFECITPSMEYSHQRFYLPNQIFFFFY